MGYLGGHWVRNTSGNPSSRDIPPTLGNIPSPENDGEGNTPPRILATELHSVCKALPSNHRSAPQARSRRVRQRHTRLLFGPRMVIDRGQDGPCRRRRAVLGGGPRGCLTHRGRGQARWEHWGPHPTVEVHRLDGTENEPRAGVRRKCQSELQKNSVFCLGPTLTNNAPSVCPVRLRFANSGGGVL